MDRTDSRTRHKVTLNPTKVLSKSATSKVLPPLLLSHVFYVVALYAGKEWVLASGVGVPWVLMRVLAVGGLGVVVWELIYGKIIKHQAIEWPLVGMASLCLLLQQAALLAALSTLPPVRVIMFTLYSAVWPKYLVNANSANQAVLVGLALVLSLASDAGYALQNVWTVFPGYTALGFHAMASIGLEQAQGVFAPSVTPTVATAASTLGACALALPLYLIRRILVESQEVPVLPLGSLAIILVLTYSVLYLTPATNNRVRGYSSPVQAHTLSFSTMGMYLVVFGFLAFSQHPTWMDPLIALSLFYGLSPDDTLRDAGLDEGTSGRLLRSYLKTILANAESRKIFYFLVLNLWFMLIQMLYGVWTNSLGLISDAIHMAFDCMAIAVGLIASVMATWPANERFTYGYGRIETLSGFANGIFLILISIFIIFEAIQRLMDPPEMNTRQLLLISSLGLGVNLFGMFAMGGHAHHGHSHGHGHSHVPTTHSHSAHEGQKACPSSPEEDHNHLHSHSHSHSQASSYLSAHLDEHSHSHSSGSADETSHSHSNVHSHSHLPEANDQHSHSHLHSHSHSRSPPPPPLRMDGAPPAEGHSSGLSQRTAGGRLNKPESIHIPTNNIPIVKIDYSISPLDELSAPRRSNSNPLDRVRVDSSESISPVTPNYSFERDDHYDTFHDDKHVPNLHNPPHTHDHHHEGHSHNMRGVFLHVMADTLGSVGVIVSTLLIRLYGWTGFDPIASMFIAVLIAASVAPLVIDTGKVLALDVSDRQHSIEGALKELGTVDGLASFTYPRFWPKDDSTLVGSIHLQLAPSSSSLTSSYYFDRRSRSRASASSNIDRVVERVDALLRSRISGLAELTIQVEESK